MSVENACGEASSSTDADSIDSSVECPTCGRSDFANRQGMKTHHKKIHGKSLANTIDCDWCGTTFERRPAVVKENDHNFCGDDCRGEWLSKTNSGADNHSWVGYETTTCKNCGDTFEHKPHMHPVFCDMGCRDDYKRDHGDECNFWKGGMVEIECERCGDEFKTYPSRVGRKKYCSNACLKNKVELKCEWCDSVFEEVASNANRRTCCSRECWTKLRISRPSEEQPNWRGGHSGYDYGENWYSQRRKARKRDHYSCQVCGRDERQLGKIPSCHHVTKLRHYRDNYDAPEWYERGNRLDNLILLCEQHHKKWEGIPLRPQVD